MIAVVDWFVPTNRLDEDESELGKARSTTGPHREGGREGT